MSTLRHCAEDAKQQPVTQASHIDRSTTSPREGRDVVSQRLLDAVPVAAYICNVAGHITCFNEQAAALWGRRPKLNDDAERYCGSFRIWTISGAPLAHNECWMARAIEDERSYAAREAIIERADGSRRVVLAHASPLYDDGTLCGAMNVLIDVTETRQSENELRRTSHLLQAVADGTTDAVFVKDVQGRYLFFNEAAARFVGRGVAEVIGQTDADIFEPASAERIKQRDRRVMDAGLVQTDEEELTAAGVTRTYLVTKAPYRDNAGRVAGVIGISRDITQRKQAERELRASEERLRSLVAAVPDMIFRLDAAGVFTDCKVEPSTELIAPPEFFLGKHYREVMPPTISEQIKQAIAVGRTSGQLQSFEYQFAPRPDQPQWYEARLMVAPDGQTLVVARNVSARKQSEIALRQSEARLKLALATAAMGVWEWDLVTNEVFWSPECYAIAQTPDFEGTNAGFQRLVHPDDLSRVMEAKRRAIEQRTNYEAEFRIIRPSGETRWVTNLGRTEYDADGRPRRMVGIVQDVTERHVDQDNLQKTEQLLRAIFDAEPECLKLLDADARILDMNAAGLAMIGVQDASQIIGHSAFEMLAPEFHEAYRAMHERVLRGAKETLEFDVIGFGGVRRSFETHAVPLWRTDDPQPLHLAITRDVTERKKLEEQFRQSQKMEAVGRLAGGIAHDFNNLLTVISGFSELLAMKLDADSPLRTAVQAIQDASVRAAGLTRQLLAFSRKQVLAPTVLNLNHVVRATEELLQRLIGEDILMSVDLARDLQQVKVDRGQIEQVIMNLVVNARDTMPQGGRIDITTRNVPACDLSPASLAAPGFVELAVKDSGHGMTDDVKARIFDPFFTTKDQGKGTGLGLAVVHGIVTQSGGRIDVETRPGLGTTFRVLLPSAGQVETDDPVEPSSAAPRGGSEKILLVEDDEAVRQFTLLALDSLGYRVLPAKDGPSALELLQREPTAIDLLVTDVVMPEMSGPLLAEMLRLKFPELRVLFVSGYADDAIVERGLLQSSSAFLHKPFAPQSLASKVREVLDEA